MTQAQALRFIRTPNGVASKRSKTWTQCSLEEMQAVNRFMASCHPSNRPASPYVLCQWEFSRRKGILYASYNLGTF